MNTAYMVASFVGGAAGSYWAVNLRLMGKVSGASGERPPE